MSKTVVKGGMIVDGTGNEPFTGHILIENDRIVDVVDATSPGAESLLSRETDQVVDAHNLAVSPGFIDCHSHFDWMLPLTNHQDFLYPVIEQGITTVITGNCGFSPAPVSNASYGTVNLRALEEVLTIGLNTGVKLQISHFIFVGRKSWPTAHKALRMVEAAQDKGLRVMMDVYPHFCGNSYLNVFLPAWFAGEKKPSNAQA